MLRLEWRKGEPILLWRQKERWVWVETSWRDGHFMALVDDGMYPKHTQWRCAGVCVPPWPKLTCFNCQGSHMVGECSKNQKYCNFITLDSMQINSNSRIEPYQLTTSYWRKKSAIWALGEDPHSICYMSFSWGYACFAQDMINLRTILHQVLYKTLMYIKWITTLHRKRWIACWIHPLYSSSLTSELHVSAKSTSQWWL